MRSRLEPEDTIFTLGVEEEKTGVEGAEEEEEVTGDAGCREGLANRLRFICGGGNGSSFCH